MSMDSEKLGIIKERTENECLTHPPRGKGETTGKERVNGECCNKDSEHYYSKKVC